ncbi:MAG: hypothetical protein AB8B97_00990 [Granulosicoccus sp.]
MKSSLVCCIGFVIASVVSAYSHEVEADPLPDATPGEIFGVYGTRWADWVKLNHDLIGFYIYQIPRRTKPVDAETIDAITETDVEVLAMQVIYPSVKERFMRKGRRADRDALDVVDQIVENFSPPAFDNIRNFSIDEENFWWDGRAAYLTDIYTNLKKSFRERKIWQWFNDNQHQFAPVEERFEIPADGYITDMYSVPLSDYEDRLLGYVSQGKPVVSTLWASPNWKHGERARGRQDNWWNEEGWRLLYTKTLINRRHGVRTALFMYDLPYKGEGRKLTPNYKSEDPCARAFTKKLFNETLPVLGTIATDSKIPAIRPQWMAERCPAP